MSDQINEIIKAIKSKDLEISKENKKLDALGSERKALSDKLIEIYKSLNIEAAGEGEFHARISRTLHASFKDPEKFFKYLLRTHEFQLFERRIAAKAYKEILEQRKGKPIPGLESYENERITISKAK